MSLGTAYWNLQRLHLSFHISIHHQRSMLIEMSPVWCCEGHFAFFIKIWKPSLILSIEKEPIFAQFRVINCFDMYRDAHTVTNICEWNGSNKYFFLFRVKCHGSREGFFFWLTGCEHLIRLASSESTIGLGVFFWIWVTKDVVRSCDYKLCIII